MRTKIEILGNSALVQSFVFLRGLLRTAAQHGLRAHRLAFAQPYRGHMIAPRLEHTMCFVQIAQPLPFRAISFPILLKLKELR